MLKNMSRRLNLTHGIDLRAKNKKPVKAEKDIGLIYGNQGMFFDTSPKPKKWQIGRPNYEKPVLTGRLVHTGSTLRKAV